MRLFAIADPHLSGAMPKPMTVFGSGWRGHPEAFFEGWRDVVSEGDLVLLPGDISWAMKLDEALVDLQAIADLPGRKVLLRGNHDYWWPSISRLRRALPAGMYAVQNDAVEVDGVVVSGTRGWTCPGSRAFSEEDRRIYLRESERLALSLSAAAALTGRYHVVMLHFPPTNARLEPSLFTEQIKAAEPDALVFGHVHGYGEAEAGAAGVERPFATEETTVAPERLAGPEPVLRALGDIAVHFVAADALGFVPKLIKDFGPATPPGGGAASASGGG